MIDYVMLKSLVWSGVDDVTGENVARFYEFRPVTHADLVSAEDNSFADPSRDGHEVRFTSGKTGGFIAETSRQRRAEIFRPPNWKN